MVVVFRILRADLDDVTSLATVGAVAGEGGAGVIVGVGVGVRAGLLEDGRVVDLPVAGLARLGLVVGASAAVLISVELHAGTAAGDCRSGGVLLRQLVGAVGVNVGLAAGVVAVVLAAAHSLVGAVNGEDGQGQIVAVDKGDIVVVLSLPAVHGELGQGDRRSAASSAALDLVAWRKRKESL